MTWILLASFVVPLMCTILIASHPESRLGVNTDTAVVIVITYRPSPITERTVSFLLPTNAFSLAYRYITTVPQFNVQRLALQNKESAASKGHGSTAFIDRMLTPMYEQHLPE
ncbi:hypothetical protein BJV74DRAFT_169916 [Russula compacta]|nr:hypothetical protein BJV74DRAFT_169916 [Russula compacta]